MNKAKCKRCGDIIESKSVHDYVHCKCGAIAVDGGEDYIKRTGNPEDFDEEFDRKIMKFECILEPDETDTEEEKTFDELILLVGQWFDEKGLHDPVMQMVKVQEEVGELAHEVARHHYCSFEMADSIGDSFVTLIGMCHHLGLDPTICLRLAYKQIRDRKGKVINNSFVKEEDVSM